MTELGRAYAAALRERAPEPGPERRELLRATLLVCARQTFERAGLPLEWLAASALFTLLELPGELEQAARLEAQAGTADPLELAHRLGKTLDDLNHVEALTDRGVRVSDRKRTGSFFTPSAVARAVVLRSLPLLPEGDELPRVCDLAVGGGAFLLEAARVLLERARRRGANESEAHLAVRAALHGVDRSELAVATAEAALCVFLGGAGGLPNPRLAVGDSLLGPRFMSDEGELEGGKGPGEGDALRSAGAPAADPSAAASHRASKKRGAAKTPGAKRRRTKATVDEVRPFDFRAGFPALERGFDWIVGNPPWVAYQGRAARPLPPELRRFYRQRYEAFRGYPTLQALFIERSAELAPRGVVSLLVPSSVSDLEGYAALRRVFTKTHEPVELLEEYGQDAFFGVVQPCFGLVARPRAAPGEGDPRPWRLEERPHHRAESRVAEPPRALERLRELPPFPPELFGELGFQTNREVTARLLLRAPSPRAPFELPLLEGRNVREFQVKPPALFLHPDACVLGRTRCTLRPVEDYARAGFVVRQTAAILIAARHTGERFRNSLLAGFELPELDRDLVLALLNSSLYRALHVAAQRDARQATFPQVKVSHLRRLPRPPHDPARFELLRALSRQGSERGGLSDEERRLLDRAVGELFGLTAEELDEVNRFLLERIPRLGRAPSPAAVEDLDDAEALDAEASDAGARDTPAPAGLSGSAAGPASS